MRTTCELGTYKRFKCIGHGLHNLVIVDGFKSTNPIKELMVKVRKIVKALRYRVSEVARLYKDEEHLFSEMSSLSEEFLLFEDEDDDEEIEREVVLSINEENSTNTYKTLKMDVKTRWHSTVPMIESLLGCNKSVVKLMLQKTEHPELLFTSKDYILLKDLLDFLKNFQIITAIFSGENYVNFELLYAVFTRSTVTSAI